MGYWKTHTGLGEPSRDDTYDSLPIFLGILPYEGFPEQFIVTEEDANDVFLAAGGLTLFQLRAQLLAATLNALKFPGFADSQFPDGTTVADAIGAANAFLNDLANGIPNDSSEMEATKDLLDAANNNSSSPTLFVPVPGCLIPAFTPTPTPTPPALGEVRGPTGLPNTGGSPDSSAPGLRAFGIVVALLALGSLSLAAIRRREP